MNVGKPCLTAWEEAHGPKFFSHFKKGGRDRFHVERVGRKVKRARDFFSFCHLFQDGGEGCVFVAIVFFGIVAFFFCPLSSTVEFFHLGFDGLANFDPFQKGERLGFGGREIDFVFHD